MFKKLVYTLFIYFLVSTNTKSSEPVLSQAIPRIPSEERCQLAKSYIDEMILSLEKNLANYKIMGNCSFKKNDLKMAFNYWGKAALLGDEESLANIGRISALSSSSHAERVFGLKILSRYGEQYEKEQYLVKLFAALSLMANPTSFSKEGTENPYETVLELLLQAIEMEKQYDMSESAMIAKYLLYINYFDQFNLDAATLIRMKSSVKDTDAYYCYMHEALTRDLYKVPTTDEAINFYSKECSSPTLE